MSDSSPWFKLPDSATTHSATTVDVNKHQPSDPGSRDSIVIIGAGLAGCALAYILAAKGKHVTIIDSANDVATAASGNTAALLRPHITRDDNLASRFSASGFIETLAVIDNLARSQKTDKLSLIHI